MFSGTLNKNVTTRKAIASIALKLCKNVANRYKRKVKKIQNHSISGYRQIKKSVTGGGVKLPVGIGLNNLSSRTKYEKNDFLNLMSPLRIL